MTLIEAINKIDSIKPNAYTQSEKVAWLSRLDGIVKLEIIDTHDGAEETVFDGYNDETLLDTELLVNAPYDNLYIHWLEAMIDYNNAEFAKYNNSITAYNDVYRGFRNFYNKTHVPKCCKNKFF